MRDYYPTLQKEAILLASALLANPGAREKHFKRATASATMSILYDYPTLETENDKTLEEIHAFNDRGSEAAAPGAHFVEVFPWMMLIPDRYVLIFAVDFYYRSLWNDIRFAKWKREGRRFFMHHTSIFEALFDNVRSEIVGESAVTVIRPFDLSHHSIKGLSGQASVRHSSRTLTEMDFPLEKWPGWSRRCSASLKCFDIMDIQRTFRAAPRAQKQRILR